MKNFIILFIIFFIESFLPIEGAMYKNQIKDKTSEKILAVNSNIRITSLKASYNESCQNVIGEGDCELENALICDTSIGRCRCLDNKNFPPVANFSDLNMSWNATIGSCIGNTNSLCALKGIAFSDENLNDRAYLLCSEEEECNVKRMDHNTLEIGTCGQAPPGIACHHCRSMEWWNGGSFDFDFEVAPRNIKCKDDIDNAIAVVTCPTGFNYCAKVNFIVDDEDAIVRTCVPNLFMDDLKWSNTRKNFNDSEVIKYFKATFEVCDTEKCNTSHKNISSSLFLVSSIFLFIYLYI